MHIIPVKGSVKGPASMFTGDVYFDEIAKGEEPSRLRVNSVHFTPGARIAWHSHAVGQTLHVTEGIGFVQARGGEILAIRYYWPLSQNERLPFPDHYSVLQRQEYGYLRMD